MATTKKKSAGGSRTTVNLINPMRGLDEQGVSFLADSKALAILENLVYVDGSDLTTEGTGYNKLYEPDVKTQTFKGYAQYNKDVYILSTNQGLLLVNVVTGESTILEAFSQDIITSYAKLNDDLIITTNVRTLLFDGVGLTRVIIPDFLQSETCKAVVSLNNRMLYVGLSNNVHSVLVSDLNNPLEANISGTNENDGYEVAIDPSTYDGLLAVNTIYEQSSNLTYAVLFKRHGIYLLKGDTNNTASVSKLYEGYGTYNNKSHVRVGNDIYFLNEQGLYNIGSTIQSGNTQVSSINTQFIQKHLDTIKDLDGRTEMVLSPNYRELLISVPNKYTRQPSSVLVYAFDRRLTVESITTTSPYWTHLTPYAFEGLHVSNERTLGFKSNGTLYELRAGNLHGDTLPTWRLTTSPLHFGAVDVYKQIDYIYAYVKSPKYPEFTASVSWHNPQGNPHSNHVITQVDELPYVLQRAHGLGEGKRKTLARYGLKDWEAPQKQGRYFYGFSQYGKALYSKPILKSKDNVYGSCYYGSAVYTKYTQTIQTIPIRGYGIGQLLTVSLSGKGEELTPLRLCGLSLRVNLGGVRFDH
jgi:hypothetical protein